MKFEETLRAIAATVSDAQMRCFACKCCRKLLHLFPEPAIEELILFGEARSLGNAQIDRIPLLLSKTDPIYDSLYPGYGDPSPLVLALNAASEVAFTESSLVAAINATEFAAESIAKHNILETGNADWDGAYAAAYELERACQYELLVTYFELPTGRKASTTS